MGKIRITTLGGSQEDILRDKKKVQREEKKKREEAKKIHLSGMKGGQRVKEVGAQSEEEIEKFAKLTEEVERDMSGVGKTEVKEEKAAKKRKQKIRSNKYKASVMKIDQNKLYAISDAIPLLRTVSLSKFDETVELHLNTVEKGLRGTIKLPHGIGKEVIVAIADQKTIESLLQEIEKGKINFHALVAHPAVMGKLAKVAKFLGPKGLMPNPKNGTISEIPEKVAEKLKGGTINWKTEADFPLIHQVIGKLSFKDKQLEENFQTLIKSVGEAKILKITLKSTMSPGIKIQFN